MFIEFHRAMLADRVRNDAFHEALRQVISANKTTVADIGSGTGLLGFLASRLGAKAVYLYEYSEAFKLSQKLAKANRIPRCHFIHQHSAQVEDPARVDVIVSETLGNYAFEENIIETIEDAKRFLKPDGIIIPQRIQQFVTPVTSARFYEELTVWDELGLDIDFTLAKLMSLNNLYVRTVTAADLLDHGTTAQRWDQVDLRKKNHSVRRGGAQWTLAHDTHIYGFAMWWTCELVPGVELSTSPFAPRTHWEQLYFPVLEPLAAKKGDVVGVKFVSDSRYEVGVNLQWDVTLHTPATGATISQSLDMKKGDIR